MLQFGLSRSLDSAAQATTSTLLRPLLSGSGRVTSTLARWASTPKGLDQLSDPAEVIFQAYRNGFATLV
ncbi:MAG TPA: hypothetical protein VER11_06670 [Polyangiaceae bacterium]|nr:hypothetical protein [Polyangiaceae bacterium]